MKKLYIICLTPEERQRLHALVHTGRVAAYKRRNAQLLLFADESEAGPGMSDREVAERVGVTRQTVENVRRRCVLEGLERVLERRKRSRERSRVLDGEAEAQLIAIACSEPPAPGHPARYDAEYERNGVAHLLLYYAPLENWRRVDVEEDHVATTWAGGVRQLVEEDFPEAERITLVMDNLNTHTGASLYKAFPAPEARRLLKKLEFVYTPRHGS